ncbi:MAG: nitroreductase family protein [Gemmatimonadaceae bacterium]
MPVATKDARTATGRILDVAAAAESRHSIRQYKQQPVPDEDLREIIRLTGLAPSPWNLQPWRIVVVREPALKAKLTAAAYGQRQVASAPAVFVLYSDMKDALANLDEIIHPNYPRDQVQPTKDSIVQAFASKSEAEREQWGFAESNIALGYLMLVARSMGYDTSPMLGFKPDEVKALLALPAHVTVPALVSIGVADEGGFPAHRHAVDRIARFR